MNRPSFPDGNGVRHAMRSDSRTVPTGLPDREIAIMSTCLRWFVTWTSEILDDEPASCMSCLVHGARELGP